MAISGGQHDALEAAASCCLNGSTAPAHASYIRVMRIIARDGDGVAVRAVWLCVLARMRTGMQVDTGTHLIGRRIRRGPSPWVSAESGEIFALVALPEL